MKFEIIEAYIIKRNAKSAPKGWSLHIYFPELQMDMRGVRLFKAGQGWWCEMPHQTNWDAEDKKLYSYPVLSFVDSEKTKALKNQIKESAIQFIENKLKEFSE